ncbi:hypothetical protein [Methermicoccus shengliensis]|uniref:Uncharacterized protein n=1 Tax=Methermicoccus shengliensis TaxID=660064 RepID=A0A832VYU5_9EURY|nr:MAG: hypothetical protein XD46_0872 [Euryarchaeota archaeon 55_53]KUK30178.1 MAG: hypothetical protein XD62_0704 [Methanosarcinales archeaon 56_1174]MDI3488456.1 hypothetical protein [Methanosarcinales archaeon]MDN5295738.1 hypothetical protein [Methanosarcinales archaeon]HIH69019.1 hypothetical protein [Methermicoccus shengliensis]
MHPAALPVLLFSLGFLPIGLAVAGKVPAKGAQLLAIFVGITTFITACLLYSGFGMDAPDYLSAAVVGTAGVNFIAAGLPAFGADGKSMSAVVVWTGIMLLVAGAYVMSIAAGSTATLYVGLAVFVFGILCELAALPAFGIGGASFGWLIVLLVIVNTLLAYALMLGLY